MKQINPLRPRCLPAWILFFSTITLCVDCVVPPLFNGDSIRVTVQLPESHPARQLLFPESPDRWSIRWLDSAGKQREKSLSGTTTVIELEAGAFTPVLAYPDLSAAGLPVDTLMPCGALFPLDVESGRAGYALRCDAGKGLSARLAMKAVISASGGPQNGLQIIRSFNWKRFRERSALLPEAQFIDQERFLQALLSGHFSVYDIREKETRQHRLEIPASMPETATLFDVTAGKLRNIESINGTRALEAVLPDGAHLFLGADGFLSAITAASVLVPPFFSPYRLPYR